MNRKEAIETIMQKVGKNDIVVSSCGYTSRELYRVKDRNLNFYMMGSMGNEIGLALGMALNCPLQVHVITGDGSCMMGLNQYFNGRQQHKGNLHIYVLHNGCYESTGGQPAPELPYNMKNVTYIDKCEDIPPRIPLEPKQITKRFQNAVQSILFKRL